jgi:hypothetical protein
MWRLYLMGKGFKLRKDHSGLKYLFGQPTLNSMKIKWLEFLSEYDFDVGILVVVIDVNPSHGFWTARLIKVFGHEGQCTCIYNTHEWIVYIMLFPVVCGTSRGSSWLRRNEFLKMTK